MRRVPVPLTVNTTSVSGSSPGTLSEGATHASRVPPAVVKAAGSRVATVTLSQGWRDSAVAIARPICPPPITRTRRLVMPPARVIARWTAAAAIEAAPRAIPVSARARLPAWRAAWHSLLSSGPVVYWARAAAYAVRSCPTNWTSPSTIDSIPPATRRRCRAASIPDARIGHAHGAVSLPQTASHDAAMTSSIADGASSGVTAYTSVRPQVESTSHSVA
jgi:hypothetical protein